MHKLRALHLLYACQDWQRLIMKALSSLMLSSWPHGALRGAALHPHWQILPKVAGFGSAPVDSNSVPALASFLCGWADQSA